MSPTEADESLIRYPCEFRVKAMGLNEPGFERAVIRIVGRHLGKNEKFESYSNTSRQKKYLSVTVRFTATSRRQLDAIYTDLSDEPCVLVAL